MREPLDGHATSEHLDHGGPTADEISPLATPPTAPLTYSDESPDTARREPTGRQSIAGEAKDEAEKIRPMDVKGRIRHLLLGKASSLAGGTGQLIGQTLGQFIHISILTEDQARELADRAGESTETLTTAASHGEQLGVGAVGSLLAGTRAKVARLRDRRPTEINPLAVALLAGTLTLGGAVAIWLLLSQRRRRAERKAIRNAPRDGQATPPPAARKRRRAAEIEVIEILE